jgi:hypothetical protein
LQGFANNRCKICNSSIQKLAELMSDQAMPDSEIILYQTEDGRTRIQCRLENETLWLTQAQMAELFETTPQNVTLHLKSIFAEAELAESATCKDFLQVLLEGGREVSRKLRHYRLEAVLAVGFRVRSHRGTQFRQWAIGCLNEYLVKGFTIDDERLKNPPARDKETISMSFSIASATSALRNDDFIRRCWISTQRVWTTSRMQKPPNCSSPQCRTRCIGQPMITRRLK